ncbi:hypothetical protein IFM89_013234 [Coptis chinensis]|uniref:Uncharacterized protein n=1 Tax=Coptis chinensis TaxID=261450 RepID=A0A835INH7_9MAGN|nr:hypothetical protein IFM89_013234 [Coptis chinensis]
MNLSYLCQEATKWACVSSQTPGSYKVFLDGLRELGKKNSEIIPDEVVEEDVSSESTAPCDSGDDCSSLQPILDPNASQTKGRNKDDGARGKHGRYVHPMEATGSKKKRKCRSCNLYADHDSRNCSQNPNSKKAKSLATNETS